jgi:DNA gyrase subunit A
MASKSSKNGASETAYQPQLELETNQFGRIRRIDIDVEMKQAYLSYSMSVIVSRALPDARDGLKPVQRRILYVMHDTGLNADKPYRKSARIVGDVLGKYHPHGDASVYDAMARMAQDFSMRYLLVDGQGNFGSVDGDPPAAMRYTEARLSKPAMDVLADLDKDTVAWQDNYDGTHQEPTVLPAALPNLILNGATGIAVGMATNIPPHNMNEICGALDHMLEAYIALPKVKKLAGYAVPKYDGSKPVAELKFTKTEPTPPLPEIDVDVDDLMKFIKGPDFPTGGIAFRYNDAEESGDAIKTCYATGRGKIIVQAKTHFEDGQRGKQHIIVTELPYAVNKAALIERIADLARDEKITGITDIRDESDRRGMRIVIDCAKGEDTRRILAQLYKYTAMKGTFGVIMLALVDGEPRVMSLKKLLSVFIEHRREIVHRRSVYDLLRTLERAHILEGLVRAIDMIDAIIKHIRASRDTDEARKGLISTFKFSEMQANAILEMPLRRLARLERDRLEDELNEKRKLIKYLEDLLAHPIKMLGVIKDELAALKERFGDARRTTIVGKLADAQEKKQAADSKNGNGKSGAGKDKFAQAMTRDELVPTQTCYVVVGVNGKIGRVNEPPRVTSQAEIVPAAIVKTTTKELLYVVGSSGKSVVLGVNNVPQEDVTTGGGAQLTSISAFPSGDDVVGAFAIDKDSAKQEGSGYVVTATANGMVKRSEVSALTTAVGQTFTIAGVSNDDALISARKTNGAEELMLFTQQGMAIRFKQEDVRPMGLPAGGVVGIKLDEGDIVVSMGVADESSELEIVLGTTDGKAKRIAFKEYPVQGRAGKGVITAKLTKDHTVADAVIADAEDTIVYVTLKGNAKSLKAKNLTRRGRPAAGDDAIAISGSDRLVKMVVA